MKTTLILLALVWALAPALRAADRDQYAGELIAAERSFCDDVAKLGVADAFALHMADECFLPNSLGLTRSEFVAAVQANRAKAGMPAHPGPSAQHQLTWTPAKVDVSADGTLGYTWGKYESTSPGDDGKQAVATGIYLTIWKRQADGSWKFVYDGAPELPDAPAALRKFFARDDFPRPAIHVP